MQLRMNFRNDDYMFFSDSVSGDTLAEALKEAEKKMKDYKGLECSVVFTIAWIDEPDYTAEILLDDIESMVKEARDIYASSKDI